jgi:hypothetical protein
MKASERRLLMILAVLAAVCGAAIFTQRLLRLQHEVERHEQALRLKSMESSALLADATLWRKRLGWLQASQPAMNSENQASEEMLEALLASAAKHTLVVQKKQLHEVVTKDSHRAVDLTLSVQGDVASVFRWLHAVQAPESFCAVPQLKIVPDSEKPTLVLATVRFSRLHAPATVADLPQEEPKS